MTTVEEIKLPEYSSVINAFGKNEDREKTVVVEFNLKPGNRVYNGKRVQEKMFGGIFSAFDSNGKIVQRCFYDMTDGTPGVPLYIEDKISFDLKNPIHYANYLMLTEKLELYPESREGIKIIDTVNNNKLAINDEEQKVMLKARIMSLKKDERAMKVMYRRTIGATTGITFEAIYGALLELSNTNPAKIVEFFESSGGPDEQFKMMLDLAKEKRVIVEKDNFLIIKATNSIVGSSYETAVIRLRDDAEMFGDIQKLLNDTEKKVEKVPLVKSREISMDPELWDLQKTVSEVVMDTGGQDQVFHLELNSQSAMDDFIKNLVKNKILSQDQKKKFSSEVLPVYDMTKTQLVDLFKKNSGLITNAKNYLK